MPAARLLRRALYTSALLLFWLPAFGCAPDHIDAEPEVSWVYDGDTVRLKDGRKLRFIGINTPELGHGKKADEPFAQKATQALIQIIEQSGHRIKIRYGRERKDQYGRLLAHVYTPDKQSINTLLLRQGLGAAISISPNTWNADCYFQAELAARERALGIWKDRSLGPVDSTRLPRNSEGFHIVTGKVVRIGKSKRATWLNLEGDVALRIDHSDKVYFPDQDFESLQGKRVEARGWIYEHKRQLRMRIRAPRSLKVIAR
jgi:endonuclease YncB( thermonuclease family)